MIGAVAPTSGIQYRGLHLHCARCCFPHHQAAATPYQSHVPAVFTSKVGVESTLAVVTFAVAPMILEARKAFDPDDDEFDAIPW